MQSINEMVGLKLTMVTADNIVAHILKVMTDISQDMDDNRPVILGTMIGAQASVGVLEDLFTKSPIKCAEFDIFVERVRKNISKQILMGDE